MARLYVKKHYGDLADWIGMLREAGWDGPVVDSLTRSMANRLASDNEEFQRDVFYAATGYGGLGEIRARRIMTE